MEKAMATYSSTIAWKIPWMEEPGRLQSMRSLRVRHDWVTSLSLFTFHFHALQKEMATHSSVLAWRIPGTGEPGGLPSMGSHRVGHDWSDWAAAAALTYHQGTSVPFSPRSRQYLFSVVFLIVAGWQVRDGVLLWFWLPFPSWLVTWSTSSCAYWPSEYLLGKMSVHILCPFFNQVVRFFSLELLEFFMSYISFACNFSRSVGCLLFTVSFTVQKLFNLM